jgi:hypothetical protein
MAKDFLALLARKVCLLAVARQRVAMMKSWQAISKDCP